MKFNEIPTYNDPVDFENEDNIYPCNTQFMIYNPLQHKYFLTEEALNYYGIDVERKYVSDSPNKVNEFIEKCTKKIYDYIAYKSGWNCFQIQMFRIAKGYGKAYQPYEFRRQFQDCLVAEAKWLLECGNSASFSMENMEKGVIEAAKPEDEFMDTSDIAKEAKRTLNFLGLDRWFRIGQYIGFEKDEY